MKLPSDPLMLLSVINMKLRDFYSDLDELCSSECVSKLELCDTLAAAGYEYNEERRAFLPQKR